MGGVDGRTGEDPVMGVAAREHGCLGEVASAEDHCEHAHRGVDSLMG